MNGQCATVGCPTGLTGTTTGGVVAANIFHLPKPTGTPVVMVVQDFSGSMCEPNTAGVALADGGGGAGACAADPAQSKAGIVNTAMAAVLGGLQIGPGKLELGLFAFPGEGLSDAGPNACQVPATPTVAIGDSTVTVAPVMAVYASGLARIAGGTPTAAALLAAAQDPRLAASDPSVSKYLVLITDGLPNCNDTNPCVLDPAHHLWSDGEGHGCESPSYEQALAAFFGEPTGGAIPPPECACAVGPCTDPDGGNAGMSCCTVDPYMLVSNNTNTPLEQAFASRECLDSSNTVQAVQTLYAQGITTVVISLGYDVTDPTTLDLMAQAGLRNPVATHVQCDSESTLAADLNSLFATLLQ